jgi:uncharacterized membrane protein YgaE (UPF0421/DUF939 family)
MGKGEHLMDIIIYIKNIGKILSQISGVLINIIIGIGTGLLSSYIISRYYKEKEVKKDTEKYMYNFKKHIIRICRYLIKIDVNKNEVDLIHGYINDLIDELTDVPIKSDEYKLNEFYENSINIYKKHRKQIDIQIAEYNRCTNVLPLLKRMKNSGEDVLHTENQLKICIMQMSSYMTDWLKLRNDMQEYENK